ncbi:Dynactin subunit 1 [Hypsizygus marmoreus]|uniref:Dynactin subunit 1 n=1 Tax=Hypsizygus marmoreus TaxID=39966 RepID=A0A369J4G1_HYPMA|nr:Dynactin subunit 1 [Hypsizygus marmoreus]
MSTSTTPGKGRVSGIPGPGRSSGIPTPGRSRSSSSALQQHAPPFDVEYMSRAFVDAIKANDPAQHRHSQASSASLSPQSASLSSLSGRRSVAGRPSSVASTSSAASSNYPQERAKTPVSARPASRPPSRHSDVFGRSTNRAFEVGDNVRIESLGYEGTLRYIGEIEGKLGLWAGVELSGGFSGKGKNNGTVNGKQYFSCPQNCGVFVATTKLSPPTVGFGAVPRPSSVASSRSGRITPAMSGRITPSGSLSSRIVASTSQSSARITPSMSGRTTPSLSSGRVTPGTTPAARARRSLAKSTAHRPDMPALTDQFTAGSRASKYMTMTAKQLSSRDAAPGSPSHRLDNLDSPVRSQSSPSHSSRTLSSPTRLPGSPFSTPKPGLNGLSSAGGLPTSNKNRPSLSTPRARIPSAIAMPPPASPMSSRSVSLQSNMSADAREGVAIAESEKSYHERIHSALKSGSVSARPESASSVISLPTEDESAVDRLVSRIDALEYENDRLRGVSHTPDTDTDQALQLQAIQQERDDALGRITSLEATLTASEGALEDQRAQVASLVESHQQAVLILETKNSDMENKAKSLQANLDEQLTLVKELQSRVGEQEDSIRNTQDLLSSKEDEIASLGLKLQKMSAESRSERVELGSQIDELRLAGQETIALYEERINAADSQRYELETRISSLEAGIQSAQTASPRSSISHGVSSAAQIDNETLREQVLHLQRKISTMEDMMEDAHATSEKEEVALRERMRRLKEKEDAMKKELNDGRKEVERMSKAEVNARSRVEEVEEALRESTVALENAQAEVEALRAELANLDGLVANSTGGDLSSRVAEVAQRASADRARYKEELATMQELLETYRAREQSGNETPSDPRVSALEQKNAELEKSVSDLEARSAALTQTLDERSSQLEAAKKKNNRDVSVNNGTLQDSLRPTPPSPSSKYDLSAAREEMKGLKHIVQELQKENLAATQRIKILESENELLVSEAMQLRQEVQILEENLDQSFTQEEANAASGSAQVKNQESPRKLKEQKSRLEMEQEQLQKRLVEAERKNARTIHDLNKEISELEALVEAKIYREDELEQELERMRERLARQKKSSKSSTDTIDSRHKVRTGVVCEICERPGHDIFNCDVLNKEAPAVLHGRTSVDLFCEDCEGHGHVAADCPHSLDVF